jgi:hypothetical protein
LRYTDLSIEFGAKRSHLMAMKQSDIFRENAENCLRLAESKTDEPDSKRFKRMAEAWRALADEQDWLDGESRKLDNRKSA